MKSSQIKIVIVPFVIFILTLILKSFSQNLIPDGIGEAEIADLVFYYAIQIVFWILTAFLINRILILVLWEDIFTGTSTGVPRFFADFVSVAVYVTAIDVIYLLEFNQPLDNKLFTFTIIALVIGTAFRHKVVNFFNSFTINVDRPYNIGDWIEVIIENNEKLLGQVIDINRRTTRLRTEENTNIIFPNLLLNNSVVNNFSTSGLTGKFKIDICLDYSIDTKRAKRILFAGAKEASLQNGFLKSPEPQVIIKDTNEFGVSYQIIYWITPWTEIEPQKAADIMYSNVLNHLSKTGLAPAYPKQILYNTQIPLAKVDYDYLPDKKEVLKKIEIFKLLADEELSFLSEQIAKLEFERKTELIKSKAQGTSMFVLIEGLLEVFVENENNQDVKVAQLTPGDFFGEMSLLTGEARSATVIALTDVAVFEITKEVFEKLLKKRNGIVEEISGIIESRQLHNLKKIAESEIPEESLIKRIRNFFHL